MKKLDFNILGWFFLALALESFFCSAPWAQRAFLLRWGFSLALGALGLGVGRGVDKWWETLVEGLERGWEKWGLVGVVFGFGFSTFISPFDGVFPRLIALFFGFSTDFSFPRWGFSTVCGELGGGWDCGLVIGADY